MTANNSVGAVRLAIAAQLTGIPGLRVYDVWPGIINPPAAVVRRIHTDYGTQFDGGDTSTFGISLYFPAADTITSQQLLDDCLSRAGTSSVIAALGVDSTLGGIARSTAVTDADEEGLTEVSGVSYLSAMISMIVVHE